MGYIITVFYPSFMILVLIESLGSGYNTQDETNFDPELVNRRYLEQNSMKKSRHFKNDEELAIAGIARVRKSYRFANKRAIIIEPRGPRPRIWKKGENKYLKKATKSPEYLTKLRTLIRRNTAGKSKFRSLSKRQIVHDPRGPRPKSWKKGENKYLKKAPRTTTTTTSTTTTTKTTTTTTKTTTTQKPKPVTITTATTTTTTTQKPKPVTTTTTTQKPKPVPIVVPKQQQDAKAGSHPEVKIKAQPNQIDESIQGVPVPIPLMPVKKAETVTQAKLTQAKTKISEQVTPNPEKKGTTWVKSLLMIGIVGAVIIGIVALVGFPIYFFCWQKEDPPPPQPGNKVLSPDEERQQKRAQKKAERDTKYQDLRAQYAPEKVDQYPRVNVQMSSSKEKLLLEQSRKPVSPGKRGGHSVKQSEGGSGKTYTASAGSRRTYPVNR